MLIWVDLRVWYQEQCWCSYIGLVVEFALKFKNRGWVVCIKLRTSTLILSLKYLVVLLTFVSSWGISCQHRSCYFHVSVVTKWLLFPCLHLTHPFQHLQLVLKNMTISLKLLSAVSIFSFICDELSENTVKLFSSFQDLLTLSWLNQLNVNLTALC